LLGFIASELPQIDSQPYGAIKVVSEVQEVSCKDRLTHSEPADFEISIKLLRVQHFWAIDLSEHHSNIR
jgi:hypothetical protein